MAGIRTTLCLFGSVSGVGTRRAFSAGCVRQSSSESVEPSRSPLTRSSVAAGSVLRGLNIFKNQTDPVALEDHEYPEWLWDVLTPRASLIGASDDQYIDPTLTKKQRKRELKRLAKEAGSSPVREARVPIHHQTINLPAGLGSLKSAADANDARSLLRKALRQQRRAKIKETNFLKTM